jgi:predicted amidohydrolase YtcJ
VDGCGNEDVDDVENIWQVAPVGYVFLMPYLPNSGFLRAGRLTTFDPRVSGDSIWWEDGRIKEVGWAEELSRKGAGSLPQFEFPNALVTPGFVDSHTHFAGWAVGRRRVQLAGALTLSEALARIQRGVPDQGWDANGWEESPKKHYLDPLHGGPVFLDSLDLHAAWVNTAALKIAGINRETPDPFGGRIVRDGSGDPTGLLLERAVELVRSHLPDIAPLRLREALLEGQREAHRLGITAIHNVEDHRAFDAFHQLEDDDQLRMRVLFHHPVADLPHLIAAGTRSGSGGRWLTHGGVKMFLDGSLGSRTAWMLQAYEGTRERGMPISEEATAREAMTLAAAHGLASVVHAIGDAAVRRALDLMEPLPLTGIRHRIEHFQCVNSGDLDRAAGSGIALSMQPAHILTDIPLAERHWGQRSAGAYAFRTLLDRGSLLAFGSDTPVASLDPREGVYAAMERKQRDSDPAWYPGECLDFETVVRGYTVGPARAARVEHRRGRLAPGYDADLVVWALNDGRSTTGRGFREAQVTLTVVGGEPVYNSK